MTNKPGHLLILPRLRVQNANAISSPMTWGFPAMSAFVGLMHALERRLPDELYLELGQVGVICHSHEILSSSAGYNLQQFHLTRNPVQDKKYVQKDGSTKVPAIAEEGRMHMDISLIFDVSGDNLRGGDEQTAQIAQGIDDIVHGMRIAGGSVLPRRNKRHKPRIVAMPDGGGEYRKTFRRLRDTLLPGFALVLNEQALTNHIEERRKTDAEVSRLDAWLDFARLHHDCQIDEDTGKHQWTIRSKPGWRVPIPIGYKTLSAHEPGEVANARDPNVPFRFVESLYSIGQWVSPHRLDRPEALLWRVQNNLDNGIYRLTNNYTDSAA